MTAAAAFNPEMLALARKSRGKTQTALAKASGLAQPVISRYEAGFREITDPDLERIADALDYPPEFFARKASPSGPGITELFHRKRQSMSVVKLAQAYAVADIRRREISRMLESWPKTRRTLPEYNVDDYGNDPAQIARTLRAEWNMPDGPVHSMTDTLENRGCVVVQHDFAARELDAFSFRDAQFHSFADLNESSPLLSFVHANIAMPPDRWRWTLAHELGHLVMHFDPTASPKEMEQQADEFAGEFLAPARDIRHMLRAPTISKLAGTEAGVENIHRGAGDAGAPIGQHHRRTAPGYVHPPQQRRLSQAGTSPAGSAPGATDASLPAGALFPDHSGIHEGGSEAVSDHTRSRLPRFLQRPS